MKEGILVVNKPVGLTSHDVVEKIRKKFGMRRVGHGGTLDPLATGVLIVLLGRATKLFNKIVNLNKAYRATLILGTTTTSADIHGKILEQKPYEHITRENVEGVFKKFLGDIQQVPPMVSAVKIGGKKLYKLARKGIEISRPARSIRIDSLKLEDFNKPHVKFFIECSRGTYVRQLAEDVGKVLGCGACITQIERTCVGQFKIDESLRLEDLNESHIQHWEG